MHPDPNHTTHYKTKPADNLPVSSQLSVIFDYLGVNWAYLQAFTSSQPQYLSHFTYPSSSSLGIIVHP